MSKKTHCDLTKILDLNICLKKQVKRWGKFVKWQQLLTVIDEMIISPNIMIWRFYFYFQPLPTWVRRDSKIIADFSVDRERLLNMGYSNVFQCSAGASSKRGENTNSTIMDYLKRVVPRMFQVKYFLFLFLSILTLIDTNWHWMTPNDTKWHQHEKLGLKKLENWKMADFMRSSFLPKCK